MTANELLKTALAAAQSLKEAQAEAAAAESLAAAARTTLATRTLAADAAAAALQKATNNADVWVCGDNYFRLVRERYARVEVFTAMAVVPADPPQPTESNQT